MTEQLIHKDRVISAEFIYDMPEMQYHEDTGYGEGKWLTRSMICDYIESPSGFKLRHVDRHHLAKKNPTSKSMRLGTYVDILLTEGEDRYAKTFKKPTITPIPEHWIAPSGKLRTAAAVKQEIEDAIQEGKVFEGISRSFAAFEGRLKAGQSLLDTETDVTARFICERIRSNETASVVLGQASRGQTVCRVVLNLFGKEVRLQCRIDLDCHNAQMIGEIKTSNHPKDKFLDSVVAYGYNIQDVLYTQLYTVCGGVIHPNRPFVFVVGMNRYPWDAYVYSLPDAEVAAASKQLDMALCGIVKERFSTPSDTVYVPHLPMWRTLQIDNLGIDEEAPEEETQDIPDGVQHQSFLIDIDEDASEEVWSDQTVTGPLV